MSDNLTWGLVGVEVAKEAIKFLSGQAGEALKRWREHKDAQKAAATVPSDNPVPAIFSGDLAPLVIHVDEVAPLEGQLATAKSELSNYVDDTIPVSLDNPELLKTTDALRRMLESVYQQRLTFHGEQREPSGPFVKGEARGDIVSGELIGVDADEIVQGKVIGSADAIDVQAGATVAGVRSKRIG